MHDSAPPRGLGDSRDNVGVASTAAKISAHALADLRARQICQSKGLRQVIRRCAGRNGLGLFDGCGGRHDLARRTEYALVTIVLYVGVMSRLWKDITMDSCE